MTEATFQHLPADIMLEVVNFLELPDPISLLLTCSSLHNLSSQRSFWISVLETTRRKSMIACPFYADLSQYTLESLKGLVVSWLKLQANWNRPCPRMVQPVISTRLPEPAEIVFHVQGTDILILDMRGRVCCWDVKLATPFPFPPIETGGRVTGISAPLEAPGICALPFSTVQVVAPYTAHRYIVTIKHENGKAIGVTHQFCEVSVPDGLHYESLFLTEDVVGSIVVLHNQDHCTVTVGAVDCGENRLPDSTSILKLLRCLDSTDQFLVCFPYKGHLYNLLEDGRSVQIQHISRNSLRSGGCEQSGLYYSEIVSPVHFLAFCFMIPSTPFYGVSAVFVRVEGIGDDGDDSIPKLISFTFLTHSLTHASDDGVSSPLAFDKICCTEYVRGTLVDQNLVWMDHSGFIVIAVVMFDTPGLILVRYHPDMRSTTIQTLTVPDTIDLLNLKAVWVDGAAGAVHLADKQDLFFTLRYV